MNQIDLKSPLGFLQAISGILAKAKSVLPLKSGDDFDAEKYSAGTGILRGTVQSAIGGSARVRIIAVTGGLSNCHDKTLDITYDVFVFNFPSSATPLTEVRRNEIERPAAAASETNAQGAYLTAPLAGYNGTRHFFGGIRSTLAAKGTIFDNLNLTTTGSAAGTVTYASMAGTRSLKRPWIDSAQYEIGYVRSDLPTAGNTLKESALHARFIGQASPVWGGAVTWRYGLSVAGGNQRAGFSSDRTNLASSSIGTLRWAVGGTARFREQSAAASYAMTLGSTRATPQLDYVKQIVDADLNGTIHWVWWLADQSRGHYPLAYQLRLNAGLISTRGALPVTERFFGGDAVETFFPGAVWDIRSGPLIRSIQENGLNGRGIGGDRFFSLNLTVSPTVWALPLVPWKVLRDPNFPKATQFAINTGVTALKLFYEAQQPAAKDAAKVLDTLKPTLDDLDNLLIALRPKVPPQLRGDVDSAEKGYEAVVRVVTGARSDPAKLPAVPGNVRRFLTSLASLANKLAAFPAEQKTANDLRAELQTELTKLQTDMKAIDEKDALAKAEHDFAVVKPVLNTFINELNGLALGPVGIFDLARMHPDRSGLHYAVGGGVRFTLLNLSLTFGWAHDPNPVPQVRNSSETFVSFEVLDLFR